MAASLLWCPIYPLSFNIGVYVRIEENVSRESSIPGHRK